MKKAQPQTLGLMLSDFCEKFANKKPVHLQDKTVRKMFVQEILKLFRGQK